MFLLIFSFVIFYDLTKMSSFLFDICENNNICDSAVKKKGGHSIRGQPGTCVPSGTMVLECTRALGVGCGCDIPTDRTCAREHVVIMDIYIVNSTDQTLHLLKKEGVSNQVLNPEGNKAVKASSGWVAPQFSPPQTIGSQDTVFIRAYAYDPTRNKDTFQVTLQYSIGLEEKDNGILIIPICRNKPLTADDQDRERCFGLIKLCSDTEITITPPSAIYSLKIDYISETNSQVVVEIIQATPSGPTGCNPTCKPGEKCENGKCVKENNGGIPESTIIIITVSVLVIFIVIAFIFFLLNIHSKEK